MAKKEPSVLAAFGQLNRDDAFKTMTRIMADDSRVFVRKEAYTAEAVAHINKMKETHKKLSKAFSRLNNVRLVNTLNSGGKFIDFEYVSGCNLEYKAFESILSGDYDEVVGFIDRIFDFIDSLSSQRGEGEDKFVENINNLYRQPPTSKSYINPGIVDLNFDNFILGKSGELVAFDYEWVFSHPVAADFVKTRLLYTFFARRSEAFAFLPNKDRPFKAILTDDTKTLFPAKLYSRYTKHLSKGAMKKYWEAEDVFQKSVNKHHLDSAADSYSSFAIEDISSPHPTFPETEESNRVSYDQRVKSLEAHAISLENELNLIKSSSAYGVALKLRSVKNKVTRRRS